MAIVKVCDICGKVLPPIRHENAFRPLARYKIERIGLETTTYDLCSPCMNEMTDWIKAKTKSEG